MTTTFIPVGGLLTTHQSLFFHEPAGKPASHSEASQGCHSRDTSRASRAIANLTNDAYDRPRIPNTPADLELLERLTLEGIVGKYDVQESPITVNKNYK